MAGIAKAPPASSLFYDQHGKIVFTVNRGLAGVGLERKLLEPIRDAEARREKLPDYAHDRETDMARAYAFFRERLDIEIPND